MLTLPNSQDFVQTVNESLDGGSTPPLCNTHERTMAASTNLSLPEASTLENLPSELLLMIGHSADSADNFGFIEERKMIASLRQTCRRMNWLFSEKFSNRYLSKLLVRFDQGGLRNLEKAAKSGMGKHVKSLEIDASTMTLDDTSHEYKLNWDKEFLQIYDDDTLSTTITSCVPYMTNLEVLKFRPPQAAPFRSPKLELLESRWSSFVELLTPIALTHAQKLTDINIKRAFHNESYMACYASMSLSRHIFHTKKLSTSLTTLSLNLRLNVRDIEIPDYARSIARGCNRMEALRTLKLSVCPSDYAVSPSFEEVLNVHGANNHGRDYLFFSELSKVLCLCRIERLDLTHAYVEKKSLSLLLRTSKRVESLSLNLITFKEECDWTGTLDVISDFAKDDAVARLHLMCLNYQKQGIHFGDVDEDKTSFSWNRDRSSHSLEERIELMKLKCVYGNHPFTAWHWTSEGYCYC